MKFILPVAGKKYHIEDALIDSKPLCRKQTLKSLQLSLIDTPPYTSVCARCRQKHFKVKAVSK